MQNRILKELLSQEHGISDDLSEEACIQSLVPFGSVVSEEKIFRSDIKNSKRYIHKGQQLKHGLTDFHKNLTTDRSHHSEHFYPVRIRLKQKFLR